MVAGIVFQIFVTLFCLFIVLWVIARSYWKGYNAGMKFEALGWADAVSKCTPPNWQSLPSALGDPEKDLAARKLYAETYKIVLDVIKEEIATNRLEAVAKDIAKAEMREAGQPADPGGL